MSNAASSDALLKLAVLAGAAASRDLTAAFQCVEDPEGEPGACAKCSKNLKKCWKCVQPSGDTEEGYTVSKDGTSAWLGGGARVHSIGCVYLHGSWAARQDQRSRGAW